MYNYRNLADWTVLYMSSHSDGAVVVDERVENPAARAGWCAFWFVLGGFAALHAWVFGYWVALAIPVTAFPTLLISGFCGLVAAAIADKRIPPLPV
jgi:hypothetical protein